MTKVLQPLRPHLVQAKIPPESIRKLKRLAKREGLSVAAFVRRAVLIDLNARG